jgi:hypothetical protein
MNKPMNTKYVFEFEDGTTAEMTLAFYALYMLKSKNKSLYERYNQTMSRMGNQKPNEYDELDAITILYAAYVCANLDAENIMSEEEFMYQCGSDRMAVANAVRALTQPKKTKASATRS